MCFNNFPSLTMAISHALTHRVPHKSVFPCILCAYGENFYISPDFFFWYFGLNEPITAHSNAYKLQAHFMAGFQLNCKAYLHSVKTQCFTLIMTNKHV